MSRNAAVVIAAVVIAAGVTLVANAASAQENFPNRPIRFVVPYVPGGLPDTMARAVGQRMSETIGQPVVVDNKPGAGGILATEFVAKAAPDGYTLLVGDLGQTAINLALYPKLPYDTLRDFAPVSMLGMTPFFLATHMSTGFNTFAEFVATAKAQGGKLNYGSSGVGSPHHLAMETLKSRAGIDLGHIPYKGSGQSTPALIAGQVPVLFTSFSAVAAHVKSGTVKLLAVASATRTTQAPEVSTFAELGVKDMLFLPSVSVLAPIQTPRPVIERIAAEIAKSVRHPDVVKRLEGLGIEPVGNTPAQYTEQLKADIAAYANAVKISGAKAE